MDRIRGVRRQKNSGGAQARTRPGSPRQRVLFGGCLVKADTATTVGNVADADVRQWPASVARVRARYPRARLVVPGHGAVGGASALRATEALIAAKGEAAVRALRANGG